MKRRSPLGLGPRIAIVTALVTWIAAATWILVLLLKTSSAHPNARLTAIGELLFPALLLAVAALVFALSPRRLAGGWAILFLFGLLGLPAWLFLRSPAFQAVPWVPHTVVTIAVWMCLGLTLGLIAIGLVALRRVPEPTGVHIAAQFTGSPSRPHAAQVSGGSHLVERDPPGL